MVFLNAWILFGLIPLFLIYKRHSRPEKSRQIKLLYASILFMLLAIAQPALKNSVSDQKFDSQDFIIAIDASYSMQADDLKPSRYELAKQAIIKLLQMHLKDRFTLFAFTSNALLLSPPTTDSAITIEALQTVNPNYILTKSTNLSSLFKTVAKIDSKKKKYLIVFSDGGDESDVSKLAEILKKNNITPFFVATATQKGAALKKEGKYLRDIHSSLVVSKINPLLEDLASLSGGKYYELQSLNTVDTLSKDITKEEGQKQQSLKVQSYKELFYIPLMIATILYFLSVTKLHQLYLFLIALVLVFPNKADASLLDFYYIYKADQNIKQAQYDKAAQEFQNITPSVYSYYNIATSYYKAGQYKNALRYYTQIKTTNRAIKQAIFYNMGNCAVKLKQYDRAKEFYINALALEVDKDALFNLNLIRELKTQKEPPKPGAQKNPQNKKKSEQKKQQDKKQQNKSSQSSSNRESQESTDGSGGEKKKTKAGSVKKESSHKQNNYKIGYKAYEIINKGYADEKEPW